jgi:hypothetical protein
MRKRTATAALALALIAFGLPGCSTNTQGDDASPVFFSVEFQLAPLNVNVASFAPVQVQTINVKSILKAPSNGTSSLLDARIDDYLVEWRRLDGGKAVPQSEVFAGNVIVPAGGQSTLNNFPIMSASATQRSPLDKLQPFNGGFDPETGRTEIRLEALVTFRGHTLSGLPVQGTGTLDLIFIYIPLTTAGRTSSK